MSRRHLLLISAISLAFVTCIHAREPLPEAATEGGLLSDHELKQRFPAAVMASDELENLFLRSPGIVEEKGSEGRDAMTDGALYSETDRYFLEQQNSRNRHDMPTEYKPQILPPGFGNSSPIARP